MSDRSRARRYFVRWLLALAAVAGIAVLAVSITARLSHERIERNEHAWFISQLDAVLAARAHENNPWLDRFEVLAPELSARALTVYPARLEKQRVAVAFTGVAPDGYRGPITLLVGVSRDGVLLGVRVLAHQETPGLGDAFAASGSTWLQQFLGRSLQSSAPAAWTIRKDGGDFDQFTGASVTPRAIVKGVQRALQYAQDHQALLFEAKAPEPARRGTQ
jgi:electron transport complex protein RnfG